jgi:hypothetical protein
MPQHPDPHIRRAVRVLAMVGELHKRGYQRLRVMPYMSPSGCYWRCEISTASVFYRNHGALFNDWAMSDDEVARYTSGQDNHYFDWNDAEQDDARSLADKFLRLFDKLAESGKGWDYPYAGWYQRLLGLAEAGRLPVVFADLNPPLPDRVRLNDSRPKEWRDHQDELPILPLPPPGELPQEYRFASPADVNANVIVLTTPQEVAAGMAETRAWEIASSLPEFKSWQTKFRAWLEQNRAWQEANRVWKEKKSRYNDGDWQAEFRARKAELRAWLKQNPPEDNLSGTTDMAE